MEDDCLLSVGSHTLTECFLAGKSVVEGRDAALVRDDTTRHTLHPDNQGDAGVEVVSVVQGDPSAHGPGLTFGEFPGWSAATVAAYCPSRMVEHPKS